MIFILLTIRYEGEHGKDFSFLLHKHPDRVQTFPLAFGKAHVFYPEYTVDSSTVALLLDIDPIELVRKNEKKTGSRQGLTLEHYVNDRPYVASSFLSVAIAQVLSSALSGRSKIRPDLVDEKLLLTAQVSVIRSRGGEVAVRKIFEPLGYEVELKGGLLDEQFPEWGSSSTYHLTLRGYVRLKDLLSQLYICLPALDQEKHYFVGEHEIEKLLQKGEDWLPTHPMKEFIIQRYLKHQRSLAKEAIQRLEQISSPAKDFFESTKQEQSFEKPIRLHELRLDTVVKKIKELGVSKVIDLGCGEGKLIKRLVQNKKIKYIKGMDLSIRSLKIAKDRLKFMDQEKVELFQGSLIYQDPRTQEMEAATLVEVIEHIELEMLPMIEKNIFEYMKCKYVVVTTPNVEYNVLFDGIKPGQFRHSDHRFEWTRTEFEAWAEQIKQKYSYQAEIFPLGEEHPEVGAPSQMAVFERTYGNVGVNQHENHAT